MDRFIRLNNIYLVILLRFILKVIIIKPKSVLNLLQKIKYIIKIVFNANLEVYINIKKAVKKV